jgi:hypothetical protein
LELTVKLSELLVMLTLCTIAFIYGMTRTALLVSYSFAFYWGYLSNLDLFLNTRMESVNQITGLYFVFGFIVFVLSMAAFIAYRE